MPQQRGTETSQLANVIEVIQLGRKTGILTVERDTDSSPEMGEITFDNGHITQARSNRGMQGQQALLWLQSWGTCRFLFISAQDTTRTTQPLPAVSSYGFVQKKRDTQPHRVPSQALQIPTPSSKRTDAELLAVPQRTQQVEIALQRIAQARLSRTHRQLFLLIDGQRNAQELLRLIGRRQDEGLSLLRDLAYIGVIQ
jgi:hypothetical protein